MIKSSVWADRRPTPPKSAAKKISPVGGAAEREADGAARRALHGGAAACACGGGCPRCETATGRASGWGRPLDPATRAFFEPRFGRNLGEVRIRDDAAAGLSARALGAKAYTVGADIVFAPGRYAPDRSDGRALLAHELAHVALHAGQAPATVFRSEDEAAVSPVVVSRAAVRQLAEEMEKLAARNAWSGVARTYERIEALGSDPFAVADNPANLHYLAAEAARNMGDALRQRTLLRRALTALGGAEGDETAARRTTIEGALDAMASAYGMVRISPRTGPQSKKRAAAPIGPALVRPEMPFAADLKRSIQAAAKTLAETGTFAGMLPAGNYLLDNVSITVVSGTDNSFLWGS